MGRTLCVDARYVVALDVREGRRGETTRNRDYEIFIATRSRDENSHRDSARLYCLIIRSPSP